MPNAVKGQLAKLGAALQSFTVAQRTIAVILVAALVLGVVALVSWLGKPTYTPLFSGIDPTDASAIVEQLKADPAIEAADTVMLTIPSQLGVDYNLHILDSFAQHVAPELGWRRNSDGPVAALPA